MPDIFIVEDDLLNQKIVSQIIEKLGYAYTIIPRGDKVLGAIEEHSPSLILMDIFLPGLNGLEVLKQLKTHDKLPPVIVMTASMDRQIKAEVLALGCQYMLKPLSLSLLKKRIKNALKKTHPSSKRSY